MVRGVYASCDDAAIAALIQCMGISIEEDVEYGGRIFRVPADGGYDYTMPLAGNQDHFVLSMVSVPPGVEETGCYHTHGDFSVGSRLQGTYARVRRGLSTYSRRGLGVTGRDGDFWSEDDIAVVTNEARGRPGYRAYLGTSAMIIRFYEPATGAEGALFPAAPRINQAR